MRTKLLYAALAALPLLFTPVLFFMLAEGWLNLGGGDKDIVVTLPYLIWALLFFIAAVVLIVKGWSFRRWLVRAGLVSVAIMLILFVILFLTNRPGVV
jgi:hypothetical protein